MSHLQQYIIGKMRGEGYHGREGHPGAYDALDVAARLIRPQSYLEIGVYDGGSLFSVLRASPQMNRLVLCDLFGHDWISWGIGNGGAAPGTHAHIDKLLAHLNYRGQVDFMVGDSREMVPKVQGPFDMAFVDGDHSHDIAFTDAMNAYPLVRPGGLLVMDDSSRSEVAAAIGELKDKVSLRHLFTIEDGFDATSVFEKV